MDNSQKTTLVIIPVDSGIRRLPRQTQRTKTLKLKRTRFQTIGPIVCAMLDLTNETERREYLRQLSYGFTVGTLFGGMVLGIILAILKTV